MPDDEKTLTPDETVQKVITTLEKGKQKRDAATIKRIVGVYNAIGEAGLMKVLYPAGGPVQPNRTMQVDYAIRIVEATGPEK